MGSYTTGRLTFQNSFRPRSLRASSSQFFGLPMDELPQFLKMKDGVIRPDQVVGHEFGHPETEAYQQQTADSIYAYFENAIDQRRMGDDREDLISHFLHAETDGAHLSDEEILDICFLFLIAGLDTVTASLDCFFGYLGQHPEARSKIGEGSLEVPSMVEELLRWETPVMGCARVATRDIEIGDFAVSKGEQVMALLGAANVDDAEFSDAESLVWNRDTESTPCFWGRDSPMSRITPCST